MKRAVLISLLLFAVHGFAADSCGLVSGIYTGTYQDTEGLFLPQPFPLSLYLTEKAGKVYGYTLKSADSKGAGYGRKPYALFWANCHHQQISQVYLIKNTKNRCGIPAPGPWALSDVNAPSFDVLYENAMMSTSLQVHLHFIAVSKADQIILEDALQASSMKIETCT